MVKMRNEEWDEQVNKKRVNEKKQKEKDKGKEKRQGERVERGT